MTQSYTDTTIIEQPVGITQPALTDTITLTGFDFTTCSASVLNMRPYSSTTLTINAGSETLSNKTTGSMNTSYQWQAADVATQGLYVAWHTLTLTGGVKQDTPQFFVYLFDPLGAAASGDLCSLMDVRVAAMWETADTDLDQLAALYITEASSVIGRYCDREFAPVSTGVTRRFFLEPWDLGYRVEFAPYDCQSVSSVVLNPEQSAPLTLVGSGATPDYVLEPLTPKYSVYSRLHVTPFLPIFSSFALRFGYPQVDVTGTWGFPSVPAEARIACIQTVRSWLDRSVNATAVTDLADTPRGYFPQSDGAYGLPLSALRLLQGLKRWVP